MNTKVQHQLEKFKEIVEAQKASPVANAQPKHNQVDGLSMAIRNKKDAETFMAELDAISRPAK